MFALTVVLDETIPWKCYRRPSFTQSRIVVLSAWLMMGNILSHAYKGALLSSLITLRYTEPIDTIDQMVESGTPVSIAVGSIAEWMIETDPRDRIVQLKERRSDIPFKGSLNEQYMKM